MRKVEFMYVEVLNETQQLMLFMTKFNRQDYGMVLTLNMALSVKNQDMQIAEIVYALEHMKTEDTKDAKDMVEDKE